MKAPATHGFAFPPATTHSLAPFGCLLLWLLAGLNSLVQQGTALQQSCSTVLAILSTVSLSWVLYLLFLCYHSLYWTPLWQRSAPHHMVATFGTMLPLILWLNGESLPVWRGCPCVEAMIIAGFQVGLQLLPLRGMLFLPLLFQNIALANFLWSNLSPGWTFASAVIQFFPTVVTNTTIGCCASCLLGLARNRQTTTAAMEPAARRANWHSNFLHWSYLLRMERWLLAAVPADTAEAALATLSAVYVSLYFLYTCVNYNVRHALPYNPTLDMLALMLAMFWGSSETAHQKNLATAQANAYRTVRSLLHGMLPAHVAKRMEDMKARKEYAACPAPTRADLAQLREGSKSASLLSTLMSHSKLRRRLSGPSCSTANSSRAASWDGAAMPATPASPLEVFRAPVQAFVRRLSGRNSLSSAQLQQQSQQQRQQQQQQQEGGGGEEAGSSWSGDADPTPREEMSATPGAFDILGERGLQYHIACSEKHESVTVCFCDLVGFTSLSEKLRPFQVMALLGALYAKFDAVAASLKLYTVDVIGDSYMCAANLIQPLPNHAAVMVTFAERILQIAKTTQTPLGSYLSMRVGIHTGPLVSGVLGQTRMKFTLLGDTVNVASRMESSAPPNSIQISSRTYEHLQRPPQPRAMPCSTRGTKDGSRLSTGRGTPDFSQEGHFSQEGGMSCASKAATPSRWSLTGCMGRLSDEAEERALSGSLSPWEGVPAGGFVLGGAYGDSQLASALGARAMRGSQQGEGGQAGGLVLGSASVSGEGQLALARITRAVQGSQTGESGEEVEERKTRRVAMMIDTTQQVALEANHLVAQSVMSSADLPPVKPLSPKTGPLVPLAPLSDPLGMAFESDRSRSSFSKPPSEPSSEPSRQAGNPGTSGRPPADSTSDPSFEPSHQAGRSGASSSPLGEPLTMHHHAPCMSEASPSSASRPGTQAGRLGPPSAPPTHSMQAARARAAATPHARTKRRSKSEEWLRARPPQQQEQQCYEQQQLCEQSQHGSVAQRGGRPFEAVHSEQFMPPLGTSSHSFSCLQPPLQEQQATGSACEALGSGSGWQQRDILVKGKGCMRVYVHSLSPPAPQGNRTSMPRDLFH